MSEPAPAQFDHKHCLANLTARPGVYRMLDAGGKVIYVGKARSRAGYEDDGNGGEDCGYRGYHYQ